MKTRLPRAVAALFAGLLIAAGHAVAANAGWRQIEVAGATPADAPVPVALFYPTAEAERAFAKGPFAAQAAVDAVPAAAVKGLILLSHGTGGSEAGMGSLAEALARSGYLVAALRHPGDNWQDRSLLKKGPAGYFGQRPLQASRVIDAVLLDPVWRAAISSDGKGPRIGAIGHSAGGYTALALAGAQPDAARFDAHCQRDAAADPVFCRVGGARASSSPSPSAPTLPPPSLRDSRVRAIVAMAPVGAVFSESTLERVDVPAMIYVAEKDSYLVPRFHAGFVAEHLPQAEVHRLPLAAHFAFMDKPAIAIPSEDGDIGADPAGFDRAAFLRDLQREVPAFFDRTLR